MLANNGVCPLGNNHMRVAKLEFAFPLGRDLPARQKHYATDVILAALIALRPAVEIPDSRVHHFDTVGDMQLIADNAWAHYLLLRNPCPCRLAGDGPASTQCDR